MKTMRYLPVLIFLCSGLSAYKNTAAATYYVDGNNSAASDSNPGTTSAPWKTINHAGTATSILKPGDTVLINSGTYRETVNITVSGSSGKPISFQAAPGAQVIIKGSDVLSGNWTRDTDQGVPANVYEASVPAGFFTELNGSARYISSVTLNDNTPLQKIGLDSVYTDTNSEYTPVGTDVTSMIPGSFYFDAASSTLYVKSADGSSPGPQCEVGVRPLTLQMSTVNYVTVSGITMRYNRAASGGAMVLVNSNGSTDAKGNYIGSSNVIIDNCRVDYADFTGIAIAVSSNCTISNSETNYNGDMGISLNTCTGCIVDKCVSNFNNTRNFHTDFAAGGIKAIPDNNSCVVKNSEFGYNTGPGIWFDTNNANCSFIANICHNNRGIGIMSEIDAYPVTLSSTTSGPGHTLIANNLIFSNTGFGIYVSSSQNDSVVYNTLAENAGGLLMNLRGDGQTNVANDTGEDNLFLNNYTSNPAMPPLTPEISDAIAQKNMLTNYNFFQTGAGGAPVFQFEVGNVMTLPDWQHFKYQDQNSVAGSLLYTIKGPNFQITDSAIAAKLGFATSYPTTNGWTSTKPAQVGSTITAWIH